MVHGLDAWFALILFKGACWFATSTKRFFQATTASLISSKDSITLQGTLQ